MATKKEKKGSSSQPKSEKRSRTRTVYKRARGASRKSGMKWGEAALAAIVGYEGDNILAGAQLGNIAYPYLKNVPAIDDALGAIYQEQGGTNNEVTSVFINKTAGLAAILKSAYDVVKKHRLDDNDKNILLPYAIGTVFDGPKSKENVSGAWK